MSELLKKRKLKKLQNNQQDQTSTMASKYLEDDQNDYKKFEIKSNII
jgi:hypothetical protein